VMLRLSGESNLDSNNHSISKFGILAQGYKNAGYDYVNINGSDFRFNIDFHGKK